MVLLLRLWHPRQGIEHMQEDMGIRKLVHVCNMCGFFDHAPFVTTTCSNLRSNFVLSVAKTARHTIKISSGIVLCSKIVSKAGSSTSTRYSLGLHVESLMRCSLSGTNLWWNCVLGRTGKAASKSWVSISDWDNWKLMILATFCFKSLGWSSQYMLNVVKIRVVGEQVKLFMWAKWAVKTYKVRQYSARSGLHIES